MFHIKNTIRSIHNYYSKFLLKVIHRLNFPLNDKFFPPDYSDLLNLYRLTMKVKPRVSLEVGSGYSTLIFLEALKRISKKENFQIERKHYCLEQDEKYLELIKKYLGSSYSKLLVLIKTELILKDHDSQKVSVCKNFPDVKVNLFYEDRTDYPGYPIAGDAFLIEQKMPSDFTICFDGMRSTVNFMKNNLIRNYKISGRGLHGINFIPIK